MRVPLVERRAERAALRRLVAGVAERRGGALLLLGPPGSGRTRLLDDALARAPVRVARTAASPADRDIPMGVALTLLGPLVDAHAATLTPASSATWRAVEEGVEPGAARLVRLLSQLSRDAPVLLVCDDAEHADPASLRWLDAVVHARVPGAGVLLSGTDALGAHPGWPALYLAPLTVAGVGQVLGTDPEEAARWHAATVGSPALVAAVAADREGSPVPAGVVERVGAQLAALSEPARELALAAAVLGDGALLVDAAAVARVPDAERVRAARDLVAAGILVDASPLRIAAPMVAAAVAAAAGVIARTAAHEHAAAVLQSRGAQAHVVASHLLASEPASRPWRVPVLVAAATQHREAGDLDAAVALLRRALAEPPADDDRPLVLRELGFAESLAGERTGLPRLRDALAELRPGDDRLEAGRLLARSLMHDGQIVEAVGVLAEIADGVDGHVDRERRLLLEGDLCAVALQHASTIPFARARALPLADGLAASTPGERVLLGALAALQDRHGSPASATWPAACAALAGGLMAREQLPDGPAFYLCCDLGIDGEHYDVVDPALVVALQDAHGRGSVGGVAYASTFRAYSFVTQGRLVEAERDARVALEAIGRGGWRAGRTLAVGILVSTLADLGELDAGEDLVGTAGDPPADDRLAGFVLFGRARLRLAQGRSADGARDLRALGDRIEGGSLRGQHWPWRALLARALHGAGTPAGAIDLARAEVAARRAFSPRWRVTAHRALGLVLGGEEGLAELGRAAELAVAAAPHDRAAVLTDYGSALRRQGRVVAAREPLIAALDEATSCGADPVAQRARVELQAAGLRPRRAARSGVHALTASERRVAEMVAAGASNAEVARALYVTVKTVEKHLRGTYGKLGVTRSELPAALRDG